MYKLNLTPFKKQPLDDHESPVTGMEVCWRQRDGAHLLRARRPERNPETLLEQLSPWGGRLLRLSTNRFGFSRGHTGKGHGGAEGDAERIEKTWSQCFTWEGLTHGHHPGRD